MPWTPVTDYSYAHRREVEGRHPELIRETFRPLRVLDAGCGFGHLVRLLRDLDVDTSGCDVVLPEPVPLPIRGDGVLWRWDLTDPHDPNVGRFDLVICREVLEHLTLLHVVRAVRQLCHLSSRYIYVTTRFAAAPSHLLSIETQDTLDPTHITLATQAFVRLLFVLEGLRQRADLEAAMDWRKQGRCLVYEHPQP